MLQFRICICTLKKAFQFQKLQPTKYLSTMHNREIGLSLQNFHAFTAENIMNITKAASQLVAYVYPRHVRPAEFCTHGSN